MNPPAIVTSDPEQIGDETAPSGLLRTRTYRMNISRHPARAAESGQRQRTNNLSRSTDRTQTPGSSVPGPPCTSRSWTGTRRERSTGTASTWSGWGPASPAGREGLVQLTPEDPARTECAQCIAQVMKISIVPEQWEMPRLE